MAMHHYGKAKVMVRGNRFRIALRNSATGEVVTVTGPRRGIYEDSEEALTTEDMAEIARTLIEVLKNLDGGKVRPAARRRRRVERLD